jgi:hypothetical protein
LQIPHPPLPRSATTNLNDPTHTLIWAPSNLFQKLKDDYKQGGPKIKYNYDAKQYVTKSDEVKALEWNGREIRNAFQTAVALAVYDSKHKTCKDGDEIAVPEVTEDHLRQIGGVDVLCIPQTHKSYKQQYKQLRFWRSERGSRDDRVVSGLR